MIFDVRKIFSVIDELLLFGVAILFIANPLAGRSHDVLKSIQSLNSSITRGNFELLAKVVADINSSDGNDQTALHIATQAGDLLAVKSLLQLGADPHLTDGWGRTPFDYAERQTQPSQLSIIHLRIASLLLEKMSGIDGIDRGGWSPLLWAIAAGDFQRVEQLLDAGASFTLWGDNGVASLACQLGDQRILKIIEAHIDTTTATPRDRFLLAIETGNQPQVEQAIAELTEDELANVGVIYDSFIYSLVNGHREAASFLSRYLTEINVNVMLNFYGTPLQHAITTGQLEIAHELLVQHGANPNLVADSGHSPLMDAIRLRHLAFAHTLLDYGADASYVSQGYSTSISALNEAIVSGDLELTRRIIEVVGDLNRQKRGRPPMLIATSHGDSDMLELLISYGGNVNVIDKQSNLSSCLHVTACQGNIDKAQLLLSYGAHLNATNHYGDTPLMTATLMNQPDMVQFLLDYGADHRLVNDQDRTALDMARSALNLRVGDKENVLKIIKLLEDAES